MSNSSWESDEAGWVRRWSENWKKIRVGNSTWGKGSD